MELKDFRGVGPKRLELLARMGLHTPLDVVSHLPVQHKDITCPVPISALLEGEECAVIAEVSSLARLSRVRRGLSVVTARVSDESGEAECVWYNQPYLSRQLPKGRRLLLYGRAQRKAARMQLVNPLLETIELGAAQRLCMLPVYSLPNGLKQKQFRALVNACLQAITAAETLPARIRSEFSLCERNFALANIHFPPDSQSLEQASRRLSFEELLYFQAATHRLRYARLSEQSGIAFEVPADLGALIESLPYRLTGAQRRVLDDVLGDMREKRVMNRLIQGDVGSGKTILAALALWVCCKNGYQGALMAPTEILARQHCHTLGKFLAPLGIRVKLLISSLAAGQRREALGRIAAGECDIVVGTHALVQKSVAFNRLGLVITDEQHRFGVSQRATLGNKGACPDVLVMSATPIPRTLALIAYGDLDVSVLDELPPGRAPVKTHVVPGPKRDSMYGFIRAQLDQGRQAYIVCPLVEESEDLPARSAEQTYDELSSGPLKGYRVSLVHGRMSGSEKEEALARFSSGQTQALVSTTVIEVGIDVPNATVIVVEDAQRFGLAQLHQLRGRVGRGAHESFCFIMADQAERPALERLALLARTSDGFRVAQIDLDTRGPGDFLGKRQHGFLGLKFAALIKDMEILHQTNALIKRLLEDPGWAAEAQAVFARADELYSQSLRDIALN